MRWRFGPFEADAREMQLLRAGQVVPVTRKAFVLLMALLERAGRLITKTELFDTVWAGTVVTDAALSRAIRELRVALGDDAGNPSYIATQHGLGFRFVATIEVTEAIEAADPQPTAPPAQAQARAEAMPLDPLAAPRLAGRSQELRRLAAAAGRAWAGQRTLVFVSGEAGIGKSSLIEAFVEAESARGGLWLAAGRCIEQYGTVEANLPLLEALEGLAPQVGPARLAQLLLRFAPAWLTQLPWLTHEIDAAALERASAGTTAQRLLRELAQALETLAEERPLLLWLEDLHWSDPSTLDLLAFLAGRRTPARLLVLVSLRSAEPQGAHPALRGLVQGLCERGQAEEIALGTLAAPEFATLLRLRLAGAEALPMSELAGFVHQRSGGHALYGVTLIDDLVRQGELHHDGQAWRLARPVAELGTALPAGLRQLVLRQLERLDDETLLLIEAAAVAGPDFSAAALAAALEIEQHEAEERCLRLALAGCLLRQRSPVIWPDGTEAAGFGFLHALYWQATYERIVPARRAEWQRRIAEREEAAWGEQRVHIAAELAMRYEAARDTPRCLLNLELAGAAALARGAYPEGVQLLEHGLEQVVRLPEAERARRELDLRLPLGAALMAVQGYSAPEVDRCYRRALDLARDVGRRGETERVLRGLWNVALVRSRLEDARTAADELVVRAAARGDRSGSFDAFAKLGQTSMHRGEFIAARQHLSYTLALPLADDDPARLREAPRVAAYLAWVLWYGGDADAALAQADAAWSLAQRADNAHTQAFVLGFNGWLHHFRGEYEHMAALAAQQAVLAAEHGLVYWRIWSDCLLGLAEAHAGHPGGCAQTHAAIDEFLALEADVGVSHFLSAVAERELAAGALDEAGQSLARATALLARNRNAYHAAETMHLEGVLAQARGEQPTAHRLFADAADLARRQGATMLHVRASAALLRPLATVSPGP
jgi:DNA-binding winged helix-turn-helix (wHTH) protein